MESVARTQGPRMCFSSIRDVRSNARLKSIVPLYHLEQPSYYFYQTSKLTALPCTPPECIPSPHRCLTLVLIYVFIPFSFAPDFHIPAFLDA